MFSALINLFPSFDTAPDVEVLQFGQYFTDHDLVVVDMSVCGIHQQVDTTKLIFEIYGSIFQADENGQRLVEKILFVPNLFEINE